MKQSHLDEIYGIFSKIRSKQEASLILQDILTPKERASIAERWQIFKLLNKGTPHRTISRTLKVSIDKVTRGARAWRSSQGGAPLLLKRN